MIDPYSSEVLKPLYVKDEARRKVLLEEAEKIPSQLSLLQQQPMQ